MMTDARLLAEFVAAFSKLDNLLADQILDPDAWALRVGKAGRFGAPWRPRAVRVSQQSLERLNRRIRHRYPPLFESLLMGFRWASVDIGFCTLLASPPGPGLSGFERQLFRDKALSNALLSAGFLQFAWGSGGSYDPVCFDFGSSPSTREARIVSLDHEAALCGMPVVVRAEIAPSFRQLVAATLQAAKDGPLPATDGRLAEVDE